MAGRDMQQDAMVTPKMFVVHIRKLEDDDPRIVSTLLQFCARSLYFLLNARGRASFENSIIRPDGRNLGRTVEKLMATHIDETRQACLNDLCPAAIAVHAIRERMKEANKIEQVILSTSQDLLANELDGKVDAAGRRFQFDAQKLIWNMFLGNRSFLDDHVRDNRAWESLADADKVVALIIWVCVLDMLFGDARYECYKYFHVDDAFVEYVSRGGSFRAKYLQFKVVDQDNLGMLAYALNVNKLRTLMGKGHSLDHAVFMALQHFSKQRRDFPNQVERFAHTFYGKIYAKLLEDLKDKDKDGAAVVDALNRSSMPPGRVIAAGIIKGGFLMHQLNYLPGATEIRVEQERTEAEFRSVASCSLTNLKVLAMVRSHSRVCHKQHRKHLVLRIQKELGRTREQAKADVAALLWYMREGAPMLIHRAFRSLIPMMLTFDHYQSPHEASSFDPSRSVPRDEWEIKISAGLYKANVATMPEKRERPKYGALNIAGDVLGINGGAFYGATYMTLKNLRRVSTLSFADTACDAIAGVPDDDEISSAFSGSECDLGTLDYPLGVINDGWSAGFLQLSIEMAHQYLSTGTNELRRWRDLQRDDTNLLQIPTGEGGFRQYDEIQVHSQIWFRENVESITVCKPFKPMPRHGKVVRSDGNLLIIDPVADYASSYDMSPESRRDSSQHIQDEPEYENDDYYLFYPRLALLDDFAGPTPAYNDQVERWSDEQKLNFQSYLFDQQHQLLALRAIVRMDVPGHGPRYCFHVQRCLECVREKYPAIAIQRVVLDPRTYEFKYEGAV